jgi:glycosyltransferase involved in cell wall biosynthesis
MDTAMAIAETTTPITPIAGGTRCLWSVMIPTYNAKPAYLEEVLRGVLEQDPGREVMQIEIVDDCSADGGPAGLVRQIAGDRVAVHREPRNLGLAGVWNLCIQRARGQWIHILHQDDVVLPDFYKRLTTGCLSDTKPGLAYCRHAFIDDEGRRMDLSELDAEKTGILNDALQHLACRQRIQTPAVVVRRSAYEALGGFRPDLAFTLDWEMWCRIAKHYPVWYEPSVLACYRIHSSAVTSRLRLEADDISDIRKCIKLVSGYLPGKKLAAQIRRRAWDYYAIQALQNGWEMLCERRFSSGMRQIRRAFSCGVSMRILKRALILGIRTIRLGTVNAMARFKHAFSS